jgi:general secretion pathway protein D
MSMKHRLLSRAAVALVSLALLAPPAYTQSPNARFRGDPVTLNFVNAEIDGVARAMGAILKQQFVVDPRVKGTMTLYSEEPLSPREAYLSFLAALRGLGFTVVEVGGLFKVVPEADAKLQSGTVAIGETGRRGDQILTQIFKLNHENANNLVPILRPLISPNNTINANPGNNSLVITDYADNLQRIAKIIAAMDTASAGDVEVIPLKYAVASDIAPVVQRLTDAGGATGVPVPGAAAAGAGGATILVDGRSNSLIVRAASPTRMAAIRSTIQKLDQPTSAGAGNIWVVHLKNADATKLAQVLRAAFAGGGAGGATGSTPTSASPTATPVAGGAQAGGLSPQAAAPVTAGAGPSTGGFIQADPSTNSLIITAPEPLYKQIRAMIDQLDTRRAQLYIESMIVEVSPTDDATFGFQWQGVLGDKGDKNLIGVGTNFGSSGNIIGINTGAATGNISLGEGFNIGLVRNFGGTYALAAIARALANQTQTNVVSTPNLITLDNEEAKIVVGENVPFITGQFTNTGTATTNPFQTIERKDVGITLRIKPQIGEGGTVRMQIFQEQSSVKAETAAGTTNAGPSTTKRSIESTIVVDDGQIIVLGGLIEDRFTETKNKVPLLGDIPILGALFRSENRTRRKTNLMVFLKPMIMRTGEDANRLSVDRYDMIRAQQGRAQPAPSIVMPINESPVLPPLHAPAPAASAPAAAEPPRNSLN